MRVVEGADDVLMVEKRRVLVADDSETATTVVAAALELDGYEVEIAHDGFEAYQKGVAAEYDLVIIDQLMPGLLGLEVIERWKREGRVIPTIVISGVDDDRTLVTSFDVGAVDFIRKPFRLPELLARVRHHLPQ